MMLQNAFLLFRINKKWTSILETPRYVCGTSPIHIIIENLGLHTQKFRGYSPLEGEKTTGTDDNPISAEEATGVLSEAFDIGYETALDFQKSADATLGPDTYGLYGGNQWPDESTLAGFKGTYIEYCATVLEFCRRLMRIFALALDVPEDYFDSKIQTPGVTSRMMHYPAQPVGETREGLGAHTVSFCAII